MTTEPEDFPPEWLAGFVDGELALRDLGRVDRWLADHPESREFLEAQESFAPASDFWYAFTPPPPSEQEWQRVLGGIKAGTRKHSTRRWMSIGGVAALLAMAAAIFLAIATNEPPPLPIVNNAPVDSAETVACREAAYPMASDDEVRIVSLPESAAKLLVVGQHPMTDSMLLLAKADEVEFIGVGADAYGRFPEVPNDPAAEEAPVLWAPR